MAAAWMGQRSHLGLGTTGLGAAGAPEPSLAGREQGAGSREDCPVPRLCWLCGPFGALRAHSTGLGGLSRGASPALELGAEPWIVPVLAAPSAPQQCHSAGRLATSPAGVPAVAGGHTGWPLKVPSNPFCDSMQPSPAVPLPAGTQGEQGYTPMPACSFLP